MACRLPATRHHHNTTPTPRSITIAITTGAATIILRRTAEEKDPPAPPTAALAAGSRSRSRFGPELPWPPKFRSRAALRGQPCRPCPAGSPGRESCRGPSCCARSAAINKHHPTRPTSALPTKFGRGSKCARPTGFNSLHSMARRFRPTRSWQMSTRSSSSSRRRAQQQQQQQQQGTACGCATQAAATPTSAQ